MKNKKKSLGVERMLNDEMPTTTLFPTVVLVIGFVVFFLIISYGVVACTKTKDSKKIELLQSI